MVISVQPSGDLEPWGRRQQSLFTHWTFNLVARVAGKVTNKA